MITDIQTVLATQGSSLDGKGLVAVQALVKALEDGLRGRLPREYVLSSIDPGVGKTLTVSMFLKAWKERGFEPASGVLIAVPRLEHVSDYMGTAGLTAADVAVLTSNAETNALGVAEAAHGSAPILFTTHEMIRRRTRKRTFASRSEFHFMDEPRALRIWDESLVPAEGIALRLDELAALAVPLRPIAPKFVEAVEQFVAALRIVETGKPVQVPEELDGLAPNPFRGGTSNETVRKLVALAGREALLVDGGNRGKALIAVGRTFPDDFAPVVILDASGRVRSTYELWEQHRGNLRRLPEAANDYRGLRLWLWQTGSGKATLSKPANRAVIVNAVAEFINKDPDEPWLVVHFKDREDLVRELKLAVPGAEQRIQFLTWGKHDATNAFKDVSNVAILGQLNYGDLGYQALACAAAGISPDHIDQLDMDEFMWGEFQHNLLQALARGSVRKSANGIAGRCRALVVATRSEQTSRRVAETFPGCEPLEWRPVAKELAGHVGKAADYLRQRFAEAGLIEVAKKDVRDHLGITAPNFTHDILENAQFQEFLDREHIWVEHRKFVRWRWVPYPGGWSLLDEIERD